MRCRVLENDLALNRKKGYLGQVKKLVPFFWLALLLVHLAGFYVYFVFRLEAIHEAAKEAVHHMSDEELERLEFFPTEFARFGDEPDEIRHNGKMYDIARVEHHHGKIIVFALHDRDEDNLFRFISAVIQTAGQDHQPAPLSLTQFLMLQFIPTFRLVLPDPGFKSVLHCTIFSIHFSDVISQPLVPPPLA